MAAFVAAMAFAELGTLNGENRPGTIDEIILVDKSLSMRATIGEVKKFAASDLISTLLVPGDRLIIEDFFGKVERLYAGTIRSEADKSEAIRRLESIVADGAYTDIGAALDKAEADLQELGNLDRPKYVVLLTDERQEAPPGSRYVSADYRLRHPALTYVRRIDKGAYREIIIGLDVGARVDQAAPGIMKLLDTPPSRSDADFPPLPAGSSPELSLDETVAGGSATAAPQTGKAGAEGRGGAPAAFGGGSGLPKLLFPILAILVLAGAAGVTLVFLRRRNRDREMHDS